MGRQDANRIPRGVEILVKKASVDPAFKALLLEKRAEAAREIELDLDPSEAIMLGAIPKEQLEAIIARTTVPEEHRRVFLGNVGKAMLAVAAGVGGVFVIGSLLSPAGISPGRRPRPQPADDDRDQPAHTGGSDDDVEESALPENDDSAPHSPADPSRRERIPMTKGIRPDRP